MSPTSSNLAEKKSVYPRCVMFLVLGLGSPRTRFVHFILTIDQIVFEWEALVLNMLRNSGFVGFIFNINVNNVETNNYN